MACRIFTREGDIMLMAVHGYYDGTQIILNENIKLSNGQQVIVTILDNSSLDGQSANKTTQEERDNAFGRLEAWRHANKDSWGKDFDWKKEVQEALNEKYGLVD